MLISTLPKILFLDIETVSSESTYADLDDSMQSLWAHKADYWLKEIPENERKLKVGDLYEEKAGIYAEFGKIVCISLGILVVENKSIQSFRLKSIYGHDEVQLLSDFAKLLNTFYGDVRQYFLCGHNIKEFDVPYMARRMIIHGIELPKMLDISGKKPWETKHLLDTLELWKFGDYKHFTSLKLLAHILGIPSPKDDIDGSQVGKVYWEEKDLERIKIYCEKDVKTGAEVFLRLKGFERIPQDNVVVPGKKEE